MKLGEILIELGFITKKELDHALRIQKNLTGHLSLGKVLIKLKFVNRVELEEALRFQRNVIGGDSVNDVRQPRLRIWYQPKAGIVNLLQKLLRENFFWLTIDHYFAFFHHHEST